MSGTRTHTLSIAEGELCKLWVLNDRLHIKAGSESISIPAKCMTDLKAALRAVEHEMNYPLAPKGLTREERLRWLVTLGDLVGEKETFHKEGKWFLGEVAKELKLKKGTFEIRSNKAGPAIAGDVTLHAESVYVVMSDSMRQPGLGVLARTCKGMTDYTGGANQWIDVDKLKDVKAFAVAVKEACREAKF